MLKFFFFLSMMLILIYKMNFWLIMVYLYKYMFMFMFFMVPSLFVGNLINVFMLDFLSYGMILLSIWISCLMILSSEKIYFNKNFKLMFNLMVTIMLVFLIFTFSVNNLLLFYLFFESSLIPVLILILGWGYQPERIQAGMYLLFYTLLASLPLLMGIFFFYNKCKLLNYFLISSGFDSLFLYYCMMMAFLVKMPMFLVHLWLPKAHVEAPISGSMILAGVMLKLGGYGLIRLMFLFISLNYFFNLIWISLSLLGGILISLVCLRQLDMKLLIAYSSVVHMGMVLGGIMNMTYWGVTGCYLMMIAHGLCSSGLFCLANINYERLFSRSLLINKGLLNFMPSFSLWWFLLCSSNMSAPPSFNLLGEISLINSIISWSWVSMFLLMLFCFFSASYSLYLFSFSQHGNLFSSIFCYSNGLLREYMLLFLHWFPLNVLFLKMDIYLI